MEYSKREKKRSISIYLSANLTRNLRLMYNVK